jgi:(S)-ureidoglycine aminohydrolase
MCLSRRLWGARFSQILITLESDGQCQGNTGNNQYFIYIVDGKASILIDERKHRLESGSYVYLPPAKDIQIKGGTAATRILIFQKIYKPLAGYEKAGPMVSHEREHKGQPFLGNEDARLQVLLPDQPSFDMAVNIFTYQPGATLPFVETHVMEHGLMMLRGRAFHRPTQIGILSAKVTSSGWPLTVQWFVAIGKSPASYIHYKDVNRDPITG